MLQNLGDTAKEVLRGNNNVKFLEKWKISSKHSF